MQSALKHALQTLGVHPSCVDVDEQIKLFLSEMDKGLRDTEPSSLMMLPTYLAAAGSMRAGQRVAVLDAGGTNLRAAQVVFDEAGRAKTLKLEKSYMPGTRGAVDSDEMFRIFAKALLPMLDENGLVTVCFSYAFRSLPGGEAEILEFGKEVDVIGAVGKKVAAGIENALRALGCTQQLQIRVINDTAAVLYAALATGCRSAVGFILGTGTNTAYMGNTRNICAASEFAAPQMLINMESGGYALGPLGTVDRELDADSLIPGYHLHEKMTSGAYLGEITLRTAKKLAAEGFFSQKGAAALAQLQSITMPQLADLLENAGELASLLEAEEDRAVLRETALAVQRRAGKLVAANIAAVLLRMRQNGETDTIAIEENGTTFQKTAALRGQCMDELAARADRLGAYRFVQTEDDTLVGSAAAALVG